MSPLERVMRLMTHLNIAATLALAAWVLWPHTPPAGTPASHRAAAPLQP